MILLPYDVHNRKDASELKSLILDFLKAVGESDYERVYAKLTNGSKHVAILRESTHSPIIGFIVYKIESDIFITAIGISSSMQGRGYGRILLDLFIKQMQSSKNSIIRLSVMDRSQAAFNLYRNVGFKVTAMGIKEGIRFKKMALAI